MHHLAELLMYGTHILVDPTRMVLGVNYTVTAWVPGVKESFNIVVRASENAGSAEVEKLLADAFKQLLSDVKRRISAMAQGEG